MRYDGRMKFNQKISFLRRHTAPTEGCCVLAHQLCLHHPSIPKVSYEFRNRKLICWRICFFASPFICIDVVFVFNFIFVSAACRWLKFFLEIFLIEIVTSLVCHSASSIYWNVQYSISAAKISLELRLGWREEKRLIEFISKYKKQFHSDLNSDSTLDISMAYPAGCW